MNYKRAMKWKKGDDTICPVCSKDFEDCKHSRLEASEQWKFKKKLLMFSRNMD